MNIGLLIAGGIGQRMGQEIPKQFININDKPVIIYTLEAFQNHPDIDAIAVVCLDGWHHVLDVYAKQFNITKLKYIVSGGENGQGSIRNGVYELEKHFGPDDIVLIHDAIRPMVSEEIISDCIRVTKEKGNAITDICDLHREAIEKGILNSVASCTLMVELGKEVYFSKGSEKNVKLTTVEDLDIFKALLTLKRSEWLR